MGASSRFSGRAAGPEMMQYQSHRALEKLMSHRPQGIERTEAINEGLKMYNKAKEHVKQSHYEKTAGKNTELAFNLIDFL